MGGITMARTDFIDRFVEIAGFKSGIVITPAELADLLKDFDDGNAFRLKRLSACIATLRFGCRRDRRLARAAAAQACRSGVMIGWRREEVGMEVSPALRLKAPDPENARLKRAARKPFPVAIVSIMSSRM